MPTFVWYARRSKKKFSTMQELKYTTPFVLIGDDGLAHRVYEGFVQSVDRRESLWRMCDNKIFIKHLTRTFATALAKRLAVVPTCVHCAVLKERV